MEDNLNNGEGKIEKQGKKTTEAKSPVGHPLITEEHLKKDVIVYIRQSSRRQVEEHTGSTDYQRSLVQSALRYGWRESQVIAIEDDLGLSGTGGVYRPGWTKMLELIASDNVKTVITANTSRLSRNLVDLMELLALAARHRVLLFVDGKVTDPNDDNDIFFSRILGSLAEYENRIRAENMRRARLAKVRRGIVAMKLPVGFVKASDGSIIKDVEVQNVIDRVIQIFRETHSARRTLITLRREGLKLPVRSKGQLIWKEPVISAVYRIIVNPAYSGTFVYGKSRSAPELGKTTTGYIARRPTSPDERIVFYDHFPAYMSFEEQQQFVKILSGNNYSQRYRPGRGSALCQGLIVCARCGENLRVSY